MRKNKLIAILLLAILGFSLRVYHLGAPSLWIDELCTALRLKLSFPDMFMWMAPFPPLYYIMMRGWTGIFGMTEAALRFPSLIFSVLTIIYIYRFSRELYNEKAGLIAALLLSVSSYSINYAQEAKMYAMLWFWGTASFFYLYRFYKHGKYRYLIAYIIFSALSVYTMYIGFIFLIIHNIFFLSVNFRKIKLWLAGQAVIILLYLPWLKYFLQHSYDASVRHFYIDWIPATTSYFRFFNKLFVMTSGIYTGKGILFEAFFYLFILISTFVVFNNSSLKKRAIDIKQSDFLLLLCIVIPVIAYLFIDSFLCHVMVVRYMGFIHIPIIILLSKGINRYGRKIKAAMLIFILYMALTQHLFPYYKNNLKINGEDWRGLFKAISSRSTEASLLISNVEMKYLKYYVNKNEQGNLYFERKGNVEEYNSVFYISLYCGCEDVESRWCGNPDIPKELIDRYKLREEYRSGAIGFLWFTKP